MTVWLGATTVLLAVVAVVLLPPVLRRLPEPVTTDGSGPGYARLARPSTVLLHLAAAGAGTAVVLLAVPAPSWPLWWPLLTAGVASAVVDARTTWIPRPLSWAGWALGVLSTAVALVVAPPRAVLVAVLGALAAGALLWLVWRLSRGGIGFGDVRLAPLVGMAAGSMGELGWWWGLLLGTSLGAVVAVLRRVSRRPGAMPYGPALVAGPLLAALLGAG
ncbi:prepilin peptidase [Auraticoccus monumenti]|uniref:Leader peptidase (Prepilin peptidase) / N-methyltransferase n=1 Tax=Auraticoccus monumenti TaxID=675864 RepID=A0A1G7DUA1_9ACTN|nr:A24 family peptidase [Auraticoccus monumenti]SDE54992.1 leader peptidase (prepilin peptidase) / N-methyltransferase [Auraticoccus monumenti]